MRHPHFKLLKTVFAQFPQIKAVYLFGSLASDEAFLAAASLSCYVIKLKR